MLCKSRIRDCERFNSRAMASATLGVSVINTSGMHSKRRLGARLYSREEDATKLLTRVSSYDVTGEDGERKSLSIVQHFVFGAVS